MTALDVGVIAVYAILLLWIGARSGRGHQGTDEMMLGGRKLPAWAVLCSMCATELSAATFIGVPHAAYTGDWSYLQLAIGALAAKALLARFVIPLYHARGVITVYGFLQQRFGGRTGRAAASAFVAGRVLASGVRLFIASLALAAVTDVDTSVAIVCCGVVSGAYTLAGGIRAVVWTDTLQGAVFVVGAGVALFALLLGIDGGLPALFDWASAGERTRILHLDPILSLGDGRAFGVALIGAFFLTLATHATDHDMVQRLLTTKDGRSGGRALLGSALLNFPLTLLFLLIGTALAHFYSTPPGYPIDDHARILPLYVLHELPAGARGLVFAGLFAAAMSSLDSAICALSTTVVSDVLPAAPDEAAQRVRMRVASVVFTSALIGAAIAMAAYHEMLQPDATARAPASGPNLVEFALSSMTILYGGLVGIFGLALSTRARGNPTSVCLGLLVGAAVGLGLFLQPLLLDATVIAWTWWIPISAIIAYAVAAAGAPAREGKSLHGAR